MNVTQKRKILLRIKDLEADITELQRVRKELATSGYASCTMSSGGGSKSMTRLDLAKVTDLIKDLTVELQALKSQVSGSANGLPNRIYTIYF